MLQISVMHGDLRYAGAPVLVGTYDGTPLKGADSVLDRHLGGALGRRAGLGQHPGRAGTCEVFRRGTELAAVVIGLGDAGDITPGRLAAGVTTGVLQLVMEVLDSDDTGIVGRLPVAAVLIGAGGVAPLAVSASVTAIVSGVCRANRRLADLAHPVTVDRLVLVELYEERAIEAIRAAAELPGVLGSDGSEIRVDRHLVDGRNGLPGEPSPMYSQGAWKTVRVVAANAAERAEGPGDAIGEDRLVELSFTSLGRAARAEQGVSTGQRELLDLLVAATIDRPDADPQLWNTLYELLVPNSLKRQGRHGENLMYVIDEHAAALPFEMLATRSHDQSPRPLGVEVGIVRRLETRTFREVGRAATGHRALVIGDPPAAGLARLPEAAREARRVVDVLTGHGYQVTAVIGDENATGELAVDILNALFTGEYRIVHIAGHGNVSPDPTRSGVVIGTDTYLTALEIEKMMTTPDLVFLNCCHLAALRPRGPGPDGQRLEAVPPYRPDRLAAGISRQLVDNGVRAVVAAGWAVDDLAAADFAEILYDQLLRGSDLGEASLTARREVFDTHQDRRINTWGAYQVYGPPAFRIAEPTAAHHAERDPMARRELRDRLSALCGRAEAGTDPDVAGRLDRLLAAVPAEWLGAAELCAAGEVWMALGRYQRAVEAFDGARTARDGDGSERAVVQLVTVLATWAAELGSAAPDDPAAISAAPNDPVAISAAPNDPVAVSDAPAAAKLFADAERYARALLALGPTPQRWSLLAGVERRRAQCADAGVLTAALERARDHYGEADALARSTGRIDCGAALNRVVLDWVIAQREDRPTFDPDAAAALVADCLESVRGRPCPDFWTRIVPAEAALITALIEEALPASMPGIAAEYERAFDDSGRRERLALLEHLALRERGIRERRDKRLAAAADALRELRSRLDTWNR
ncbi:MAG: CHAT domain-containing protein [Pseudonocardia sp.]